MNIGSRRKVHNFGIFPGDLRGSFNSNLSSLNGNLSPKTQKKINEISKTNNKLISKPYLNFKLNTETAQPSELL